MKIPEEFRQSMAGDGRHPSGDYPIGPEHIDAERIRDAFGNPEADAAAKVIVEWVQQHKSGWVAFALKEVGLRDDNPGLTDLLKRKFIAEHAGGGRFFIMHAFIVLLFMMAPARGLTMTEADILGVWDG